MRVTIAPSRRSPLTASPLATHCTADSKCINMETERRKSTRCQQQQPFPESIWLTGELLGRATLLVLANGRTKRAVAESSGQRAHPARKWRSLTFPRLVFSTRETAAGTMVVYFPSATHHTRHTHSARGFQPFCSVLLGSGPRSPPRLPVQRCPSTLGLSPHNTLRVERPAGWAPASAGPIHRGRGARAVPRTT